MRPCTRLIILAAFSLVSTLSAIADVVATAPISGQEAALSPKAQFDRAVSADGNGSLRIAVDQPGTIDVVSIPLSGVENTMLVCRLKLRASGVEPLAFPEMWLNFPGKGEFFSKAIQNAVHGDSDWVETQLPFMLQAGQTPDRATIKLTFQGKGTVWVDDIKIETAPK